MLRQELSQTRYRLSGLVEIGCDTPVEVIGYATKDLEKVDVDLGLETSFNFYTVAQISPRKNVGNLFEWFLQEFKTMSDNDINNNLFICCEWCTTVGIWCRG